MSAQVGKDRERKLARWYRAKGHVAYTTKNDGLEEIDEKSGRKHPSHGIVDIIAFTPAAIHLVQLKTTKRPYHKFGPNERAKLIAEAVKVPHGIPYLCHWPPFQREPVFIPPSDWPKSTNPEATAWCPTCEELTLPLRDGTCGFCDTQLEAAA